MLVRVNLEKIFKPNMYSAIKKTFYQVGVEVRKLCLYVDRTPAENI